MNKTDKLNEAKKIYDVFGSDPDNIMMLTTKEWAVAKGEDVDTFDEDEIYLRQLIEALEILDEKIRLIDADIAVTEELMEKHNNNYQMKYEYRKELSELNHRLLIIHKNRADILKKYMAFKEFYENKIIRK